MKNKAKRNQFLSNNNSLQLQSLSTNEASNAVGNFRPFNANASIHYVDNIS